ncbi:MAG: hypothetical protein ACHREM_07125 [Polyangiales bacterium]
MNKVLAAILRAVLVSPFFALAGFIVVARFVWSLPRRARALRAGLRPSISCSAGHAMPMASRWSCTTCGATYLGTPIRCSVCGAGADYVVCDCGLAIPLPWSEFL